MKDKKNRVEFIADYEHECVSCGQKPTVIIKDGIDVSDTRLCGCCCFDDDTCYDPENW